MEAFLEGVEEEEGAKVVEMEVEKEGVFRPFEGMALEEVEELPLVVDRFEEGGVVFESGDTEGVVFVEVGEVVELVADD